MANVVRRMQRYVKVIFCGALMSCATPQPVVNPLPPRAPLPTRPAEAKRILKKVVPSSVAAMGHSGDFRLANGKVLAVIRGLGARTSRGAIVDLFLRHGGEDALGALIPLVGSSRLVEPHYDTLHIETAGISARIRLRGYDPSHPQVHVETRYAIAPHEAAITLTTTVENTGPHAIKGYRVADRLDTGATDVFLPREGWLGPGSHARGDRLELYGEAVSYAYASETATIDVTAHDGYLIATGPVASRLAPEESQTTRRIFIVGGPTWGADLRPALAKKRHTATGVIDVVGLDDRGESLTRGLVEVTREGKPDGFARLEKDGRTTLRLPEGNYRLRVVTSDRISPPSATLALHRGEERRVALATDPPSQLVYDVRDHKTRQPIAARVRVVPLGDHPLWLGVPTGPRPHDAILDGDGHGVLPLPPGRYRIEISAGPRYNPQTQVLTLPPHTGTSLVTTLARTPSLGPFLSVDPRPSPLKSFTTIPVHARQLWNRVAGLDVVFWPRDLIVHAIPSARHVPATLPVRANRNPLVIPLNQLPRHPHDLFLSGNARDFEGLLRPWLKHLQAGERVVAYGASTTATLTSPTDRSPRTWIAAKRNAPAIIEALVKGHSTISNGPILVCDASSPHRPEAKAGPGDLLSLQQGRQGRQRSSRSRRRSRPLPSRISFHCRVAATSQHHLDGIEIFVGGISQGTTTPIPGTTTGIRLDTTISINLPASCGDTSIVALVRGTFVGRSTVLVPGKHAKTSRPIAKTSRPIVAMTNAIWIDTNGDGRWNPKKPSRQTEVATPRGAAPSRSNSNRHP